MLQPHFCIYTRPAGLPHLRYSNEAEALADTALRVIKLSASLARCYGSEVPDHECHDCVLS